MQHARAASPAPGHALVPRSWWNPNASQKIASVAQAVNARGDDLLAGLWLPFLLQQRRLSHVGVESHQHAGQFEGTPEGRRHPQDGLGRSDIRDPRADLRVLLVRQQIECQHLI